MSAQSGQQSYFSIFFCRQTEKQKTSRISWNAGVLSECGRFN